MNNEELKQTVKTFDTPVKKDWDQLIDYIDEKTLIIKNYIPLKGTEEGKPITNELWMKNTDLSPGFVRLFFDGFEFITETGNESIADYAAINKTNGGLLIDANYQGEEGGNLAFGLAGKNDFSETDLENKLIYAQRSYVDNKVSQANSYSTDETLTGGTWIDGKPIYRKVFIGTTDIDGNFSILIANNIETIIPNFQANIIESNNIFPFISLTTFDDISHTNNQREIYATKITNNWYLNAVTQNKFMNLNGSNYTQVPVQVNFSAVIEYTKTTD